MEMRLCSAAKKGSLEYRLFASSVLPRAAGGEYERGRSVVRLYARSLLPLNRRALLPFPCTRKRQSTKPKVGVYVSLFTIYSSRSIGPSTGHYATTSDDDVYEALTHVAARRRM